jgi:hypothetical protein
MSDSLKQALEHLKKIDKMLDQCPIRARRLVNDHPDAVLLTEAYEKMPVQINLNDPSLSLEVNPQQRK